MQKSKGFTIIELLVVIAIIAVLASIVLVNVTGYINKAKDAAIKSDLSTIATGMAGCYVALGGYGGTTSSPTGACDTQTAYVPANVKTDIIAQYSLSALTFTYNNTTNATSYSAYAKLNDASFVCIDSTGATTNVHTGWAAPTAGAACPASN